MALRARLFPNPPSHSQPQRPVCEADRELIFSELPRRGGAFRGLLVAGGLAMPFWLALYLLLR
jgi:hypothetical protein